MEESKFEISSFDWEHFKKYVDTYDPKINGLDDPIVIFKDMLYGIGLAVDEEKFSYADGYRKFKNFLIDHCKKNKEADKEIDERGTERWYNKDHQLHRDNDLPAIIHSSGSKYWYKNGELHRDNDLPAIILLNGYKAWYKNGKYHRDNDLPAVIYSNGDQHWYKNGKQHRNNDLPAIINANGYKAWYQNGVFIK
jgi:antitoxin component YwqK of YwqJK toxin-antitoxin module